MHNDPLAPPPCAALRARDALLAHLLALRIGIRDPVLRRAVRTTLAINAALFALLAALGLWAGHATAGALARWTGLPQQLAWLGVLATVALLLLLTPALLSLLATLASLPLRERIFGRTRTLLGAPHGAPPSFG